MDIYPMSMTWAFKWAKKFQVMSGKVQDMTQILQGSQPQGSGFKFMHKSGLMHHIF